VLEFTFDGRRIRTSDGSLDVVSLDLLGSNDLEASVGDVASSRHPQGTADGCQAVLQLGAVREPWATTVKTGAGGRASGPSRIDVRGTRWLVAEAEKAGAERFLLLSSLRHERSDAEDGRVTRVGLTADGEARLNKLATAHLDELRGAGLRRRGTTNHDDRRTSVRVGG